MISVFFEIHYKRLIFFVITVSFILGSIEIHAANKFAVPDFLSLDRNERKVAFIEFMVPRIATVNADILENRRKLISYKNQIMVGEVDVSQGVVNWLNKMAEKYRISSFVIGDIESVDDMLSRMDVVPASLALAQSANETAWGSSRFARQGYNYFGEWCFKKGCGLKPYDRPDGKTYEVRMFRSAEDSIKSYIHNLNTHRAYESFRFLRRLQREDNVYPDSGELAEGLMQYSTEKERYITALQSLILHNNLSVHDSIGNNLLALK